MRVGAVACGCYHLPELFGPAVSGGKYSGGGSVAYYHP